MESIPYNIMETIATYDGTPALRKDCRYIKGSFYIKNEQCFFINGIWYRANSSRIAFDNEHQQWAVKNTGLIEGIISITKGIPEFGYFTRNENKNIEVFYASNMVTVIREDIILECPYVEEGVNGKYYFNNSGPVPPTFKVKVKPVNRETFYSFPWNYGSEPLIPSFTEKFNSNFKGDSLLSDAWKYLDGFTFGVEFETEKGVIPEKYLTNNGLIACRDGSITGFEYATIPLSGETGIQCIKRSCSLLDKYCACSINESLHIHVGGFRRTVRNIAALYRLGILLQKDIYSMFPYHYINTSTFKKKGYCNALYHAGMLAETPKDIFNDIYSYLSGGVGRFIRFPTGTHPMDRSGQHKWEISPRYHWLNLIPIIWGSRGTVEFRCHPPTVKSQKVINWLFIVTAIMRYASRHVKQLTSVKETDIPAITLKDVISSIYPKKVSRILNGYITERVAHYAHQNDHVGEVEIITESNKNPDIFTLTEFI